MSPTKYEQHEGSKRRRLDDANDGLEISDLASEVHSLLCLSDDADGPLISKPLTFLTVREVGRCEMTCKALRRQAINDWKVKAKSIPPSCRSESATTPKDVAVRYHLASRCAINIDYPRLGVCNCGNPKFQGKDSSDCELFVRLKDVTKVFYEGFVPFTGNLDDVVTISFEGMDISRCYRMNEVVNSIRDGRIQDTSSLHLCMASLSVSVAVVSKSVPSDVGLLFSVNNFSSSVDIRERTGTANANCWSYDLESCGDTYSFLLGMRSDEGDMVEGEVPKLFWVLNSMYKVPRR